MIASFKKDPASDQPVERREFISQTLKAAGATALLAMPGLSTLASSIEHQTYSVQNVINIILKEIPGAPFPQTVDTLKSGSGDMTVTGIVTTMFATISVIEQAIKQKANFIIAHEPTFYNHTDDPNWVQNNGMVKRKQALLQQNNIAVWRFHDYWHSHIPDGIRYGVLRDAGWLGYFHQGSSVIQVPAISLKDLAGHLKSSLGISHVRVIGDLSQSCQTLAILPGAAGGQAQISLVEKEKPDVLIVGEVHEWETGEYIRDTKLSGGKTSLIILGHCVSEEPGMKWMVEWLQPKIPGIKISHIASLDPFTWL